MCNVFQDTLVNSWNFGADVLDPTTVWHGNEHAINITADNLDQLDTDPKEIMRSMLGILHAFQFLENVLLSDQLGHQTITADLLPPPVHTVQSGRSKRSDDPIANKDDDEEEEDVDYSDEEMKIMHENHDDQDSDHEMSIVDDKSKKPTTKEWHINLFGEIVHDEPSLANDLEQGTKNKNKTSSHGVTELLFHPANFVSGDDSAETDMEDMTKVHLSASSALHWCSS
jgi:hypothetical protein